jgi:hypothetical protein
VPIRPLAGVRNPAQELPFTLSLLEQIPGDDESLNFTRPIKDPK